MYLLHKCTRYRVQYKTFTVPGKLLDRVLVCLLPGTVPGIYWYLAPYYCTRSTQSPTGGLTVQCSCTSSCTGTVYTGTSTCTSSYTLVAPIGANPVFVIRISGEDTFLRVTTRIGILR